MHKVIETKRGGSGMEEFVWGSWMEEVVWGSCLGKLDGGSCLWKLDGGNCLGWEVGLRKFFGEVGWRKMFGRRSGMKEVVQKRETLAAVITNQKTFWGFYGSPTARGGCNRKCDVFFVKVPL